MEEVDKKDVRWPAVVWVGECLFSYQVVGGHQWRFVCFNVEYLNFGMQNPRPSDVKVIF